MEEPTVIKSAGYNNKEINQLISLLQRQRKKPAGQQDGDNNEEIYKPAGFINMAFNLEGAPTDFLPGRLTGERRVEKMKTFLQK